MHVFHVFPEFHDLPKSRTGCFAAFKPVLKPTIIGKLTKAIAQILNRRGHRSTALGFITVKGGESKVKS